MEEFDIRREQLKTDQDFERALRPVRFEDFAGQDKIIENNTDGMLTSPTSITSSYLKSKNYGCF